MANMPEIRPEINKEPEDRKKGAGLLARLFGGGGARGGLGQAAAGGGILATKAGLTALILVGTTVAGSIGVVGYRLFGPGSDMGGGTENNIQTQLFATKPKDAPNPAAAAAPKDGSSKSLNYLAEGNAPPKPDAAAAPADAASAAGASSPASGPAAPSNATSDSSVRRTPLKNSGRFGEMKRDFGNSGAASVASAANKPVGSAEATAASNPHSAAAMRRGSAARADASSRSLTGKRSNKALHEAFQTLTVNRGATSSYGAGHTYDGSKPQQLSVITPDNNQIGMDGPGQQHSMPKQLDKPNSENDKPQQQPAPPIPPSTPKVPWQHAIDQARMMISAALALMMIAYMLATAQPPTVNKLVIAKIIGWAIMGLGAAIIALGAQIGSGAYGQKLQGGVLTAAGIGLIVMGFAIAAFAGNEDVVSKKAGGLPEENDIDFFSTNTNTQMAKPPDGQVATNGAFGTGGVLGGSWLVILGGGTALLGLATSMLKPPEKHPSANFNNGNPPDSHWFGYRQSPSEVALKKMVA